MGRTHGSENFCYRCAEYRGNLQCKEDGRGGIAVFDAPDCLTTDPSAKSEFLLCHLLSTSERTNIVPERGRPLGHSWGERGATLGMMAVFLFPKFRKEIGMVGTERGAMDRSGTERRFRWCVVNGVGHKGWGRKQKMKRKQKNKMI